MHFGSSAMTEAASGQGQALHARCCVVGGGPAGMMLGFLLARAGVDTIILEKHADFLRDFRGDTIHPSTLEVMNDLGLYDDFLALPHQETHLLEGVVGDLTIPLADFSHLPTRAKFIAFTPQWNFLDFLARQGGRYPGFRLRMQAEVVGLIEENGVVRGVTAQTPEGPLDVRADLVVGADGRHSCVRERAGFVSQDIGAPMDVLWFRISRKDSDPQETFGRMDAGQILVLIARGQHWQCGYVIAKGSLGDLQKQNIELLRGRLAALAPFLADRLDEVGSWNDVKLLTVAVDRLKLWHRPGLLCIGDAAHAMSPVGGVGINIAIQDAVATANILAPALKGDGEIADSLLARVQERREWPMKATQKLQLFIQNQVISRVLGSQSQKLSPPWFMHLFIYLPWLRRWPARIIGIGFRPERVENSR
jgi:2-polyprenyl-6-methoxyphenol hydroxylase-like FAD-dependent oxidoreductase